MSRTPQILYVTAGTHGAGHVARGVALGRALDATGAAHVYRIVAPPGPFGSIAGAWFTPVEIDPRALASPSSAATSALATAIVGATPDVIVIDLFWAPLYHIALPAPAWLLLRSVPPVWLEGPAQARFDAAKYAHILAIEPAPGLDRFERWPAIVCAATDGVTYRRDVLCDRLGCWPGRPLRLRVQSGVEGDAPLLLNEALARWGEPGTAVTLDLQPDLFPLGPWLATLEPDDAIVAGAGYNLFWETRRYAVSARVHWVPLPRRIDAQGDRVAFGARPYPTDGAARLAEALLGALP